MMVERDESIIRHDARNPPAGLDDQVFYGRRVEHPHVWECENLGEHRRSKHCCMLPAPSRFS